jgi:hypothetical protein
MRPGASLCASANAQGLYRRINSEGSKEWASGQKAYIMQHE